MDPALYFRIYREGVDKSVILEYIEYTKTRHLYNVIKDYV